VRRWFGAEAEIAGRPDERVAEVIQPDAVHQHAGRERIFRAGNRLSEFEPAAAFFERLALWPGQDFEEFPGRFGAGIIGVAAGENVDVVGLIAIDQGHGALRRARVGCVQFIDFALQFAQFLAGGNIEQPVELTFRKVGRSVGCV